MQQGPPNRLIHETSPYLQQHARNPVDWYPWGEEALNRAKQENRPILLSIGYSACHWCHVMEKESFEKEDVARIMNERFVNIKVDREERPDLDEVYMHAVQAITGSGGWPLTVFLTPDLVPFHGGTYFPPEDREGMPGFKRTLVAVSDYYRDHREEVTKITIQMKDALHQIVQIAPSRESPDDEVLSGAFEALTRQFDQTHGGFGGSPKFPNSMALSFLLRHWKRTKVEQALVMVERTLEKMANGGIYDQIGGGFHRYSVDERWLIPHFEKMLYDNALLSRTYFEAYQATRQEAHRRVAEEILGYVLREMRSPEGGFYSSQDADSGGEEGKFFVWSRDEVDKILGKRKGGLFCAYYGITAQGNFEKGASVLHSVHSLEAFSKSERIPISELKHMLEQGRNRLFAEREKRVKPGRDEKILTSWNGLMISSFVDGYRVTANQAYLSAAESGSRFILRKMKKDGHVMRAYKDGKSRIKGYSEDYAFFIQALLDLYEATFKCDWLKEADALNREMIRQFWDDNRGGFFFSGKENESLIAQSKTPYDNVIPSPNSVAAFNLVRLGSLTGDESLGKKAREIFRLFRNFLQDHPAGFAQMLSGLSFFLNPEEIGIIGSKEDPRIKSMLREIHSTYLPNKILSLKDPQETGKEGWLPFLVDKESGEGPAVFVCKKSTCLPPVKDEAELRKILGS